MTPSNRMALSLKVDQLVDYLTRVLAEENDVVTYEKILEDTGLDVGRGGKDYVALHRAKAKILESKNPFLVEPVQGYGLQRAHIGLAHVKSAQRIKRIKNQSDWSLKALNRARGHERNDEEALANRTHIIIHNDIRLKTTIEEYNKQYVRVSSGVYPERPIASLNAILKQAREDMRKKK